MDHETEELQDMIAYPFKIAQSKGFWERDNKEVNKKKFIINLVDVKENLYLDVLILRWLEASSCWVAFASFLSFDATTIAAGHKGSAR